MSIRLFFATLLAGGIASSIASLPAVSAESTGGAVAIVGLGGKCLDVTGGNPADGTPVIIWTCHGGTNQKWTLTADGQIKGIGDKCLDVTGGSAADGTPLIMWTCHGGPNQKWKIDNGDIRGLADKCMDVTGSNAGDGTRVIIWSCHGGANQLWFWGDYAKPSAELAGVGGLGRIEFKPRDWKSGQTSYWKDTDGVNPGFAGCHVGVVDGSASAAVNGRFFGEACRNAQILIESNPGVNAVHPHENDLGHPDTVDCQVWCAAAPRQRPGGFCQSVTANIIPPCTASALCVCQ